MSLHPATAAVTALGVSNAVNEEAHVEEPQGLNLHSGVADEEVLARATQGTHTLAHTYTMSGSVPQHFV